MPALDERHIAEAIIREKLYVVCIRMYGILQKTNTIQGDKLLQLIGFR